MNILKTKTGKIVIAQKPNWPLYSAFALYLFRFIDPQMMQFSRVSVGSIMVYWSALEIFQGVNMFRRVLGLGVGIYFLTNLLFLLQ